MIISIGNLPPATTEQEIKSLFDNSHCIETITLVREGNQERLLALVEMDISMEEAEAIQHSYHRRWWHSRALNFNLLFH